MFKVELAIKFGSNEIIVFRKGYGIVTKEPAYLAVVENGKNIKVKATGKEAEKLFHSKSSNVTVYQPIVKSEIVNLVCFFRFQSCFTFQLALYLSK